MLVVAAVIRPSEPAAAAGPTLTTVPMVTTSVARRRLRRRRRVRGEDGSALADSASLAALVPGKLSVLVHDRKSDRDLVSYRPGATYTSASLVKLLIALEALDQGEPAGEVAEMLSRSRRRGREPALDEVGGPSIRKRIA